FSKLVQTGITLAVNQDAVIDTSLKAGGVEEVVTVTENASLLNTSTPEVSTRFDERRLSELPIAPNRNVFNVLLSVPGVSQISPNQSGFANGVSFSSNGGRLRSNNFMIDGQDINDPSVSGGQIPLNNPDAIREARIITNQFLAEYGRNSGSIVNFIGKSGTNEYHGSVFIFHNNENLNSCSNLDKAAGFCNESASDVSRQKAPRRKEFQYGFTFGGPLTIPWFGDGGDPYIWKGVDKTFIFGDFQRWTDRTLGSGSTINGAPTAAGRATLQQHFGNLPQVQALLAFVPAGTSNFSNITAGGQVIQVGNLTGTSSSAFDSNQGSFRLDHRFNDRHLIYGRYRGSKAASTGGGQVTPPGITNIVATKTYAATIVLNSIINSKMSNEARIAWTRFDSSTNAQDPSSQTIPSIEIVDLGMNGFNALASRTAFGLAVNLPQFRINDTYQITDSLTYLAGDHALKFGVDLRRTDVSSFFLPTTRGRLQYTTLNNFILDRAQVASINLPLLGGDILAFYRWKEYYLFAQDEWRVTPNFTLTYGVRYEYPGDSFSNLKALNERILAANNDNPGFVFSPQPSVDTDNIMPRIGFNWNPRTNGKGILGFLTGGDKLVFRGGYSRTYDANFININLNIFSSFPFVAIQDVPATQPSFATIQSLVGGSPTIPSVAAALLQTRTVVSEDFRAPASDQFSFEVQRELATDMVMKVGYVRTRGTGLFQTVDGNPRVACPFGPGPYATTGTCNNVGYDPRPGPTYGVPMAVSLAPRVNPSRGTIRLRTNSASSVYNALQVSLDKRLSRGFSGGLHYTWSTFIDDASEIFNPSGGEVAVSMDSFNRSLDRARSSYDRPHRLAGNVVYEFPFYRNQNGFVGKVLGGWQVNSNFTFQSGAPFSVLNGLDPAGALAGINALVGDAIRPNVYTNLDVSRMTVNELYSINQQLRAQALATAQANFIALGPLVGACTPGPLPGSPLNNTLFSRAFGRITCSSTGVRGFVVDFNGIEPGQRVGNAGRSLLRSDGIANVDFGIIKNTRFSETLRVQLRADVFNLTNSRNFGIPEGRGNSASFLNQWATDGGNRRIVLGARLVF
ncbi:MAG TPA: TonB-dependent receptor plug domain-containing protein, partial [Pyrinomonadaceae bacterium]